MQFFPLKTELMPHHSLHPWGEHPSAETRRTLVSVRNCILLSVFADRYIDCQNIHSMNNTKCNTMSPYVLKICPSFNVKDEIFSSTKRKTSPIHLTFLNFIASIIIGENTNTEVCVISGFRLEENEVCVLLEYYAAYPYRHFGPTYQSHLEGSRNPRRKPSCWISWPLNRDRWDIPKLQ